MARPSAHLIVSTGLATLQWIRTGRLLPTIAPFLTGFLIDSDHLVDLACYRLSGEKNRQRILLALHGWEYVALLLLVERVVGKRFAGGLVLGYLAHLGLDQLTNETTHPLTYLITFRYRRGFPSLLFTHPDLDHVDWMQGSIFKILRHF